MNLSQELDLERRRFLTRRWFFQQCGLGLGSVALASLLGDRAGAATPPAGPGPMTPRQSPLPARAKSVIYLFMAGAPSQLELFDHKPTLAKYNGQPVPKDILGGQTYAFIKPDSAIYAPEFQFAQHGQSGAWISEAFPELARVADELTIVRSMTTDAFNHAPGQIFMNTGSQQFGRPSMGAWVTYGLGSVSQDLPGFVVLNSAGGLSGGAGNYGSGFLPTVFQGVLFRKGADPVLYLSNPTGMSSSLQRKTLDAVKELNEQRLGVVGDPEIATRINAFEMAYRMQSSAPELMDLSKESPETLALYGAEPGKASFANNCLLARRLVERGVRFVQLFHEAWDHHSDVKGGVKAQAGVTDKACAALIADLRKRGLLDDTLVVWGGEFGRTPQVEASTELKRSLGRDHHPQAFTMWLAGGGTRRGVTVGETDDFGFNVIKDKVHVHDLHATLLHLLGFDHEKLTFRFQGRDYRLTDVHGEVVAKLLA
ncbi:MAG: DUF1501 domain-containing protein [Verrucomicrobiales bacterium]|nr:DUF1501 domain-containing protein [Verrucomicrobiales bacterium]